MRETYLKEYNKEMRCCSMRDITQILIDQYRLYKNRKNVKNVKKDEKNKKNEKNEKN